MINVMVIEDRVLTLNALKTQVNWTEHGLNPVGFFTNCQEAMKELEELKPDVIISDIVMPGMDGLSFCEYINGLGKNIKIIIISAYSKFEYAKKGIQLGVYDFLEKPVDYDLLAQRIVQAGKEKLHEEQVRHIYENNHGIYQESFFQKLLKNSKESSRLDREQLEEILESDIRKMQFNCIMIAAETEGMDVTGQAVCLEISGVLSEYYHTQEFWGPFLMERDVYCIVFGEKENFLMSTLVQMLKKYISDFTEQHEGIHINIGIGYWVDDIRKLQFSADTALQALEYRFVLGKNEVFHINDYVDKELSDYTRFDYFEKRLADCLTCGDFAGTDRVCTEIRNYIENHRIKRSYLLFFVTNFLSAQVCGLLPEYKVKDIISLTKLNNMVYALDILEYFEQILGVTCRELRNSTVKDTDDTVLKIKKYIEENFREENLSLGEIAKIFNMSPNYICRIFKERTGSTLINYISSLKILQAKKLLVETDMKIGEISSELGYSSQYYFSMGFKKATGYSPKEYRKMQE